MQEPMKATTTWEVCRRINIPSLNHRDDVTIVEQTLAGLTGVRKAVAYSDKHKVIIVYDARESSYQLIADALEQTGHPPSNSWWSRLKGGFYQFSDTNARDNAKAPPPACCNKSPK